MSIKLSRKMALKTKTFKIVILKQFGTSKELFDMKNIKN